MNEPILQDVPLDTVRRRLALRRHRRAAMVVPVHPRTAGDMLAFALLRLHRRRKSIPLAAATLLAVGFGFVILLHLVTGRIFPNVRSLGVYLGSMTPDEATASLQQEWLNNTQIELIDGERVWTARPHELGLSLDAEAVAAAARRIGLAGIPFGYNVEPSVHIDGTTLSRYMATLASHVNAEPMNASYQWVQGDVVGVPGHEGSRLDLEGTLERIFENPASLAENRRFELSVVSVPPDVANPTGDIDQVHQLLSHPFSISGHDPFTNESISYAANSETMISWLEASPSGLRIRESALAPFVGSINATLASADGWPRYIDPAEAAAQVNAALTAGQTSVEWRIRYKSGTYQVVSGDTASHIAEETGIPLALLQEANPDRNLNLLTPGETLILPSRDATLPQS